jgi:hypothetical protein
MGKMYHVCTFFFLNFKQIRLILKPQKRLRDLANPPVSTAQSLQPSSATNISTQDRYKAQKCFQKALEYRLQAYGENHYTTAMSLDHVAQVLLNAEEAYQNYLASSYNLVFPLRFIYI